MTNNCFFRSAYYSIFPYFCACFFGCRKIQNIRQCLNWCERFFMDDRLCVVEKGCRLLVVARSPSQCFRLWKVVPARRNEMEVGVVEMGCQLSVVAPSPGRFFLSYFLLVICYWVLDIIVPSPRRLVVLSPCRNWNAYFTHYSSSCSTS